MGRKKLSTFTELSFSICKNISLALVCTPADHFSYKLKKFYGAKISFCAGDNFRDLDKEFFSLIHSSLEGNKKAVKPIEPRDHQIRAIINAVEHFQDLDKSRGKMVMPCGSGKSLTAYWIAQKLDPQKILIAVPSLSLVRQTLEVWARESLANKKAIRWICICSDSSIKDTTSDDIETFSQDLGVEIATEPNKIARWLNAEPQTTSIVFSTYQSGKSISTASKIANMKFDFGIFDEAHKTVGSKDQLFAHMLFDENIEIEKRLFMTATERHFRGDSDKILSMDDINTYGETFELLSFKEALSCIPPILCDYKIVTLAVTTDEIKALLDSNVYVKPENGRVDQEIEAKILAASLQLRKTIKEYPLKHCLSFHSSIARAKSFQETQANINLKFPEFEKLDCFHVRGSMPTSLRKRTLDQAIECPRSLITNARCLTEGVDVKQIDGVLFADPKSSTIDIVQAVGRALRPHPDKEKGYIIIPVLLDSDKIAGRIEQNEAYEDLLMTMRALASNDDRIIDYFRIISEGKQPTNEGFEFILKAPTNPTYDQSEFAKHLSVRVWSKLAKLSWMPFDEARAFARSLKLTSFPDWREYCKNGMNGLPVLPDDIPKTPNKIYRDKGWLGFGDWLGTARIASFNYRTFNDARKFAQSLNLNNFGEWKKLCEDGQIPNDIPLNPQTSYLKKGWVDKDDWLGTKIKWSFVKARKWVHKLNVKSFSEWWEISAFESFSTNPFPPEIPHRPDKAYKYTGWKNWSDWFGITSKYRSYNAAREFVHSLKLQDSKDWFEYVKNGKLGLPNLPTDIPPKPNISKTKDGWEEWTNWDDWLGLNNPKRWRAFDDAKMFVGQLRLRSFQDWKKYCKNGKKGYPDLPVDIPHSPNKRYKNNGWKNWNHWLSEWRPFDEARSFVGKLYLSNWGEWINYCKNGKKGHPSLPLDIPSRPDLKYKEQGWKGRRHWLYDPSRWRPFGEAMNFVRKLNLSTWGEWTHYCKNGKNGHPRLPTDIPPRPELIYKEQGWVSSSHWLGERYVYDQEWLPYRDAIKFTRSLKLSGSKEWFAYAQRKARLDLPKLPNNIPASPRLVYLNKGWNGFGDWLGSGRKTVKYKTRFTGDWLLFDDAKRFVHNLHLISKKEWDDYCKNGKEGCPPLPENIPAYPSSVYKDKGWKGLRNWLGSNTKWLPYIEAERFVHNLHLISKKEWDDYCKNGKEGCPPLPENIPANPAYVYKDKGWNGFRNWLGSNTKWLPYIEAKKFAESLLLKSGEDWDNYCINGKEGYPALPKNIPKNPFVTYQGKGWTGIKDWLGYEKTFKQFPESHEFARSLKLGGWGEWTEYIKNGKEGLPNLPKDIPKNPQFVYKDKGWKGTSHWLGLEKQDENNEWSEAIDYLKSYHSQYGHFNFPITEKFKAVNNWVNAVRSQKRAGTLNPELEKKLTGIEFEWDKQKEHD